VPGDVTLWPNLTGGEIIDLLGRLRGGLDAKRRQELIERFQLDPSKKARAYSKGNRQKVALIAALASDVELLLLDEPTSGLDPLMEEAFRSSACSARRCRCATGSWTFRRSPTSRSSPAARCPPLPCSGCASPPPRWARRAWPASSAGTSAENAGTGDRNGTKVL
jgi:ABC transporter